MEEIKGCMACRRQMKDNDTRICFDCYHRSMTLFSHEAEKKDYSWSLEEISLELNNLKEEMRKMRYIIERISKHSKLSIAKNPQQHWESA